MINNVSPRIVTRIYKRLQTNKSLIWIGGKYHHIKHTDKSKYIIYKDHKFGFLIK